MQRCIVHLVRAARKYTTETDGRDVAADLKTIAPSAVLEAEEALKAFGAKWDGKYPTLGRQWREVERHRHAVRVPAGDPQSDLHDQRARQRRDSDVHAQPEAVPERRALERVYLAIHEASKKWTVPTVGRKAALNHFAIVFEGRLPPPHAT
ncbi:mutator type : Uncharacterized protein OS=Acinetobacter sp. CIP 102129 GN=F973_00524 PE=4 SV=1: Transposase_mut [Gemmata massiliana]|uniref:Mutator family transposase n=1 Tax=Gemmata massiliana TaxID=1210884 RepID=A0A6P2D5R6_9BACT|nr:transposase [Gemmata massiliana]VTR95444.1 mutator type : Uncharacterized protein OS=Acinetobacter sp. CIP 102129 GN=F973_00524 PE=4 SV=1: Transposase_mut [Gemmata massiliana]